MTVRDFTRPFRRMGSRIRRVIKTKYGKAKIFILAAGLIVVSAVSILATGVLKQPGIDSYQSMAETSTGIVSTGNVAVADTRTINFGSADTTSKTEPEATITSNVTAPTTKPAEQPSTKTAEQPTTKPAEQTTSTPKEAATTATTGTNDIIQITELPLPASGDWLELRIEKHKAEIQPQDLTDFRAIVAKLDQTYIQGLSIDGFTSEEQTALRDHMHSKLTDTEYSRAKELFSTYNYLLEED